MWSRNGKPVSTLMRPLPSSFTRARRRVSLLLRATSAARLLKAYLHRVRVCRQAFHIRQLHRLLQVVADHEAAVRGTDDLHALEPRDERCQLLLNPVGKLSRVGDEHRPGQRVMLQLRRQVGGYKIRPGAGIGDDQDLARSGDAIEPDGSVDLALCQRDVDVAGTNDDVDARNGSGPVSEGGDRLRTSD